MFFGRAPIFNFVIATVAGTILSAPAATSHPRQTKVTWSGDVASIVQRRCAGCHVAGGFGPMALTRYEQARDWSRAMSDHAMDGFMPPWPAAAGVGDFSNDRSLTPTEIELLALWAEGGAAEGTAAAAPPTPAPSAIRAPDVIKDLPAAVVKTPVTRYEVPVDNTKEQWITGWEFHPVEHARVERAVIGIVGGERVGSWMPPETTVMFPDGVARRLPPRSTLTVDVYYRKSSAPPAGGGRIALSLGAEPKHEVRHRTLACGTTVLDEPLDVLALEPSAHESGAMVEAVAYRPDRSVEPLILVRRFLTWYVPTYRFRTAVRLPRGSRLAVRSSAATCGLGLDYVPVR